MAVTIGSNIPSVQAQRRLGDATSALSATYERLASGQRINRASDDAAGLAIASTLNAKARIYTVAQRNVSDSISAASIASDATTALTDITIRQRELATQAANGSFSAVQRRALDKEANELTNEYNRIISTTIFNGISLLSSPWDSLTTQLGVGAGATIGYQFADALATKLSPGGYFTLDGVADKYVWFTIDGQGTDPAPFDSNNGIRVDLHSSPVAESDTLALSRDSVNGANAANGSSFTFDTGANQYQVVFHTDGSGSPSTDWSGNTLNVHYTPDSGETASSAVLDPSAIVINQNFDLGGASFTWSLGSYDPSNGILDFNSDPIPQLIAAAADVGYTGIDNGDGTVTIENPNPGDITFNPGLSGMVESQFTPYVPPSGGDSVGSIGDLIAAAFTGKSDVGVSSDGSGALTVTNTQGGVVTSPQDNGSGTNISTLVQGVGSGLGGDTIRSLVAQALNASGAFSAQITNNPGELIVTNVANGRSTSTMDVNSGIVLTDSLAAGTGRDDYAVGNSPKGSPTVFDLNGDGRPDIVQANSSSYVTVLLNQGDGTFERAAYSTASGPGSATVADFNGDGRADILVSHSGTVGVLMNRGDGTFSNEVSYSVLGFALSTSATVGDLNGDGHPDIVQTSEFSNRVSVLLNRGDGTFGTPGTYTVGSSPQGAASLGDLNGDGRLDIVQSNSGTDNVSVFLNLGNGTFGAKTDYAMGVNPRGSTTLGDLNGDGRLDMVQSNYGSSTVSVRLNLGNGTFGAKTDYGVGVAPAAAASLVDLNGDGRLDIVQSNFGFATGEAVLLNQGNGTFGAASFYGSGPTLGAATLTDLNGDGRVDIVRASTNTSAIFVQLGNGNGSFRAQSSYATGDTSRGGVSVGDFDGDGRMDVVQNNTYSGSLSVLLNQGGGNFVSNPTKAVTRLIFGDARGMTQINQIDLTTQKKARAALDTLDRRLTRLSAQQGVFGSIQSRLNAGASVVSSAKENFLAAESRILDTDIGADSAELTRAQIIQQAASAILAQANQQPHIALDLLRA